MSDKRILFFCENRYHCHNIYGEKPPVIAVAYLEDGFHPVFTRATAATLNEPHGITSEIADSAVSGSMFGWHTEAAKLARDYARQRLMEEVEL